jgi:hypothetical protein
MSTNNTGWICARCQKSNAPFIASCDCKPIEKTLPYQPYPFIPFPNPIPFPAPIIPFDPLIPWYPYPYITITTVGTQISTEEYIVPNIDKYTVSGSMQISLTECLSHNIAIS